MSASPHSPNEPDQLNNGKKQASAEQKCDPAQQDAQALKRRYPLSWLLRLLLVLIVLFALVCIALVYLMGTNGGTAFLVDKIDQETGLKLTYGDGNFRDGIWVSDINIPASDDMDITIDKAYVKIGWRAIFAKEIHLRDADIHNIRLISHKPPSGDAFDYPTLNVPVNLRLDNAKIDRFTFAKPTLFTQVFSDIEANNLKWIGSKLNVNKGQLTYGYLSDGKEHTIGTLSRLRGNIDFNQDYPITAKAKANLLSLSEHHFGDIELKATGSLKNLHGKLKSKYNQKNVTGEIHIQPMESDTPLTATIKTNHIKIPYASDYDIQLKQTRVDVKGTWKKLTLNIDSELSAKHIPTGHYQGQATYTTEQENIDIHSLIATTDKGNINASGLLNWHKSGRFWMDAKLRSSNYQLDEVVPVEWKDYQGYVPKTLNGQLDFKYQHQNPQGKMQIDTKLVQKNAESLQVNIVRELTNKQIEQIESQHTSKKAPKSIPYNITANWTNLYRKIEPKLDVHHLGIIDSDSGTAKVLIDGNRLELNAKAQINQLNAVPKGNYDIDLTQVGKQITIDDLHYQGDVGDLSGTGTVTIPTGNDPILWSLAGHTNGFSPIEYNKSIPIELVAGDFIIHDRMSFNTGTNTDELLEKQQRKNKQNRNKKLHATSNESQQHHQLTIDNADVHIVLSNEDKRQIGIKGKGSTSLILDDKGLKHFDAKYNGMINNRDLPQGQYQILAKGNANDIAFNQLSYQGKNSQLDGSGTLNLTSSDKGEGISWQFKADLATFDFGYYRADTPAIVTGLLDTAGTWFTPTQPQRAKTSKSNQPRRHENASINTLSTKKNNDKDNKHPISDTQSNSQNHTATGSQGQLTDFKIMFDGRVKSGEQLTGKLPSGELKIDAELSSQLTAKTVLNTSNASNFPLNNADIIVNHLYHKGDAGFIDGQGKLTVKDGYQWQLLANMKAFNLGYFSKDIASTLSGKIDSKGKWTTSSKTLSNKKHASKNNNPLIALTDFAISFDGDIKTDKLPSGKLTINASSQFKSKDNNNPSDNSQLIKLHDFHHQGEAGFLDATGTLKLNEGYQWQLDGKMKNFNLGYFSKQINSNITGNITTNGNWGNDQQHININEMNLSGQLKEHPLTVTGQLSTKLRLPKDWTAFINQLKGGNVNQQYQHANQLIDDLEIKDLQATWGKNTLTAKGSVNNNTGTSNANSNSNSSNNGNGNRKNNHQQSLQASVSIHNLDQLHSKLKGELSGGINLSQTTDSKLPIFHIDLLSKNVALPNLKLKSGHIQGKIVDFGNSHSQVSIMAKQLKAGSQDIDKLNALLVGTEANHKLNLSLTHDDLTASGTLTGSLLNQRNHWKGVLSDGQLTTEKIKLSQVQASELAVNIANSQLQLAAHCWKATPDSSSTPANNTRNPFAKGKLCFTDNLFVSQNKGSINLALQKLDTALLKFMLPNELDWRATLNGTAKVDWQKGQKPNINARIYTDNGKIGLKQEDSYQYGSESDNHSYIPYNRVSLIALSTDKGLKLRTDINSKGKGRGYADISIDPFKSNKPIWGKLALSDLNLSLFKPFFPGLRILEGKGSLDADIAGELTKPLIAGEFKLTDGRMAVLGLPVDVSKVNTTATIHGTHATLAGSFYSGEGKAELSGTIDWKETLQAKLGIKGNKLNLSQPPLLSADINPDINLIVRPNEKYVEIKGAVSVPTAIIRPPEANEDIVKKSPDVTLFDLRQDSSVLDQVLAITQPWSINADIGVDLGDDVIFRGFGAELPLAGALVVKQRNQGSLQGKGVVQVSRASTVDAFGQSVQLKYAQFRINGAINRPLLSIEADKQIEGSTVGFRVKGDIANTDIRVFNNAGLTEQQAMNALVTGRLYSEATNQVSEEGFRSEVSNNLAAAGLSVGLNSTRSITNQIGRAVGLQSLALSASGDSNDTHVNVTGYLTPDLYIRYGIGVFNAQSELSLRYQLTERLYIEAISSTDKFVDLVYSWQF